jgi:hypothetical protein
MLVLVSLINQSFIIIEREKNNTKKKKKEREKNEYYLVSGCVAIAPYRREHTHA